MRILVTGSGGMLGRAIMANSETTSHQIIGVTHGELDILDDQETERVFSQVKPSAVINCAAWTNVDGAENNKKTAREINGKAVSQLGLISQQNQIFFVHISSDYVFSGNDHKPYSESSKPSPLSVYGGSKLVGEKGLVEVMSDNNYAIVRSSWLYGAGGSNFVETILRLASERDQVKIVSDQIGCPTWTNHLAKALLTIADQRLSGIHHVANQGYCSWFEFGKYAIEQAQLDCEVIPVKTVDFPRPALRPAFSVLKTTRNDTPRLPDWQLGVRQYLAERIESHSL